MTPQQPLLEFAEICEVLADQAEIVHNNGPEGLLGTRETPSDRFVQSLAHMTALLSYLVDCGIVDAGTLERLTLEQADKIYPAQ